MRLAHFVIYVYAPTFLAAKHRNNAKDGPTLLLQEIMAVRVHCNAKERKIIESSIQRNGFCAHHESVLVTLLSSDTMEDRQSAINLIRSIRQREPTDWSSSPTGQRPYKVRQQKLHRRTTEADLA